jgi:stearoyl-CoA desaturase (delta-9 desaturase)
VTLTWNGKNVDWVNVVYFGAVHAIALTAPWHFTWRGLVVMLGLYWLTASVGIGLGYHRLLTHRGLRVPKALEYLATLCGMLASQGGAVSWVAMHRAHHKFSDRAGRDLHTPRDGFLWSHVGWILCKVGEDPRALDRRYASDLLADPFQRVMNRLHVLPNVVLGLGLYLWGGWSLVVWGVFARVVLVLHATWFVNSATHTWGYRTYDTPEGSTNLWWVGLATFGEGWHNNHHAFQRSARHGLAWWELDPTWLLIRALGWVGLARDVQLLPKGSERFRLDRRAPAGERAVPVVTAAARVAASV